ncbi:diaminopimelate epimerase [Kineosporia mesophila]|uniref:Diaminopimelate epimerase n=1 Tax=Kineosporia mesophila TaxID=566012 RepID=A0ABP7ATY7_9ACTN|nr:diaminopimelate epimerase [Kineosporia mesophila]
MTTFAKGHGTENDFVLLDDPDGRLDLTPELIRHLSDRRAGLGADGVIRVVRSAAAGQDAAGEWFMDYWNSDGSAAEMCGNGSRVFVAHLLRRGWITLDEGDEVLITTRGGVMPVKRRGDLFTIDLGAWRVAGGPAAVAAGSDVKVTFPGMPPLPGLSIALSNPHVVVALPDVEILEALDLTVAPIVEPAPPNGTNVEIVVPLHDQSVRSELGHLKMRVHERGSGETRSCGTGTVAAALAARAWGANLAPDHWRIDVLGGTLYVDTEGTASEGDSAKLSGPAVIVAEGELV